MAGALDYGDLLDALEVAPTHEARKTIKAALYAAMDLALLDPDPLTVSDAAPRDPTDRREATHLHHQHPALGAQGSLRARAQRRLAEAPLVRRLTHGGLS